MKLQLHLKERDIYALASTFSVLSKYPTNASIQAYLVFQIQHNQPTINFGMWETETVDTELSG